MFDKHDKAHKKPPGLLQYVEHRKEAYRGKTSNETMSGKIRRMLKNEIRQM